MRQGRLLPRLHSALAHHVIMQRALQPQPQRLDPRRARHFTWPQAGRRISRRDRRNGHTDDDPGLLRRNGSLHMPTPRHGHYLVKSPDQRSPGPQRIVTAPPELTRHTLPPSLRIRDRATAIAR